MPQFLITARCHVLDTNLFEQFLILLHPWLDNHDKYAYSVEEDDTLNRHIHFFIEDNAKDRDAMSRKFTTKTFKQFKQHLSSTNTIWDTFLNIQVIKNSKEDLLKSLGYVMKDNTKRRGSKGLEQPFILEAVNFYYVSKHVDKSIIKNDVILITSKNMYAHVKDFCETQKLDYADPTIQYRMVQSGYGFSNVPPKTIKRIFTELQVMHGNSDNDLKEIIMNEQQGVENQQHWDMENHIKTLLDELSAHVPSHELPSKIQFLFKKYT